VWSETEGHQSLGAEKVRIHCFADKELNSLHSNSSMCARVCVREREQRRWLRTVIEASLINSKTNHGRIYYWENSRV
jgi:hypothetical protein